MKGWKALSDRGYERGRQTDRQKDGEWERDNRKKRGKISKRSSCSWRTLFRGAHVAELAVGRLDSILTEL